MSSMRAQCIIYVLLLTVILSAAHGNTLSAPFFFDDHLRIEKEKVLVELDSLREVLLRTTRPVHMLLLAADRMLGGFDPWGYHLTSLVVHLLVAAVFFALVYRTLRLPYWRGRFDASAPTVAFAAALLWGAHPLLTSAIAYVFQRAVLLSALFYLLALYGFARVSTGGWRGWGLLSVAACALGMGSKEVMATAPAAILLYDRLFLAGSFRGALRARGFHHLAFALTWILLGILLLLSAGRFFTNPAMGFSSERVTSLEYLRTMPGVLVEYLRLIVWPADLCFDRYWPITRSWGEAAWPLLLLLPLLLGSLAALWRGRAWGFPFTWFFLVLATTSSIYPLSDPAVEYRVYLPLAGLTAGAAAGAEWLRQRFLPGGRGVMAGMLLLAALGLLLAGASRERNKVFLEELSLWQDTVKKAPLNARALGNLGAELLQRGDLLEGSEFFFRRVIVLNPELPGAWNNIGVCFYRQGKLEKAEKAFRRTLELDPQHAEAKYNLGRVAEDRGEWSVAEALFTETLPLDPGSAELHAHLANTKVAKGDFDAAIRLYRKALVIAPGLLVAHVNLAVALDRVGREAESEEQYRRAIALDPANAQTRRLLAIRLLGQGRLVEASEALARWAETEAKERAEAEDRKTKTAE